MKARLLLLVIGGALLGNACANEPEPELPLPESVIVQVLEDIHLAESATQDLAVARRDSMLPIYYDRILGQYGIDSAQWSSVLTQLRRSPVTIERIYQRVSDSLEVRNATVREQAAD
jgi:hypothetical protein